MPALPHPCQMLIAERSQLADLSCARSRRYLQSGFGCPRCSRRGCFVCISLRGGCITCTVSPPQTRASPLVAAVFRTKWLPCERCAATCLRRRRPGQARRRQRRLQITDDIRGYPVPAGQGLHARAWVFCAARGRSRTLSARAEFPGAECWRVTIMRRLAGESYLSVISLREG